MTPRERFVAAIRRIEEVCPCRNTEYGACDIGCRCILADPHPQVPLCDCRWTGHAAAREAVEAWADEHCGAVEHSGGPSGNWSDHEECRAALLRDCGMSE